MRPHLMSKEKGVNFCKGLIYLFLLLVYHCVEFFLTMSFGIGVGILAAIVHYNFWYKELDPFWQTYITLIVVFLITELYFRMMQGKAFFKWMDKTQAKYRLLLYYIPRGMYFTLYVVTVISLYIQYASIHTDEFKPNHESITPKSPLRLELDSDHYYRTILFVMSLAYMEYALTKESDWVSHRQRVMATGEDDPMSKGSLGSFLVLAAAHLILTAIYVLPLVGFIFVFKTFVAGWPETYFIICILAAFIGVFTSFLERQNLFPREPMKPPDYAYENHLRIRVAFLHYWLIPLAAGRYFNRTSAVVRDARDGDFLVFTMEVAIGVLVASKVISNDIYILYFEKKPKEEVPETGSPNPELVELYEGEMSELGSVADLPPKKPQGKPPATEMSMGSMSVGSSEAPLSKNSTSVKAPVQDQSIISVASSSRKPADGDMSVVSVDVAVETNQTPVERMSLVSIGTDPGDSYDEKIDTPPMTSSMTISSNANAKVEKLASKEEESSLYDLMKRLT